MRTLRFFLLTFAAVAAVAALLVGAAFLSPVQTMIAQRVLDRHPGLRASLGAVTVGSGELTVRDLALEFDGAILALPAAQARLPVTAALRTRTVPVRRLVAKGWTLDLSGVGALPAPPAAGRTVTRSPSALRPSSHFAIDNLVVLHHLLTHARLPDGLTIDEVELDGEVILPAGRDRDLIGVHVTVRGGALGAGRTGTFTYKVQVPRTAPTAAFAPLSLAGQLSLALDATQFPERVWLEAAAAAPDSGWANGLQATLRWSRNAANGTESPEFDLSRGGRLLSAIAATYVPDSRQLTGTWRTSLRDADLAALAAPQPLPGFELKGAGRFATAGDFSHLQVAGRLEGPVERLGAWHPRLANVGAAPVAIEFDAIHTGQVLRFNHLKLSLGEPHLIEARTVQAVAWDENDGTWSAGNPTADSFAGTLRDVPLDWLTGDRGRLSLRGPGLRGEFGLRLSEGKFLARSQGALVADGLTLQREAAVLASDLTVSLPLAAEFGAGGWNARAGPLAIEQAGRRLAQADLTLAQAADSNFVKVDAVWRADLDAIAKLPEWERCDWLAGHSAAGTLTLQAGPRTFFDGQLSVTGRGSSPVLSAGFRASAEAGGRGTFSAPIKIAPGPAASDLLVNGSWSAGGTVIDLTGERLAWEHLLRLAGPAAAAGGPTLPANLSTLLQKPSVVPGVRDAAPFWGVGRGRISFDFGTVTAWGNTLKEVGGTLFFEPGVLRLEGGRAVGPADRRLRTEGTLTFDPKAPLPYRLKGTADLGEMDAAHFLGKRTTGREPLLFGKFTVAATVLGEGLNCQNLIWRTGEEFRLTSVHGGGTRLLETNVATALTEAPTPMADAVGSIGAVFGKVMGTRNNILQAAKNPVSKTTDAVLNFTYATREFRYDELAITVLRTSDGMLQLDRIDLAGSDVRLTGTGRIAAPTDRPLAERPLTLALRVALRGASAQFLMEAGLLTAAKDPKAYAPLEPTFHFGGTLDQLDRSEWRDWLVKAAVPTATKKP